MTSVLLDQQTGVMRFDVTHDTINPDGSRPTTVTYPAPEERRSVHCPGLYWGAVAVLEPGEPTHS